MRIIIFHYAAFTLSKTANIATTSVLRSLKIDYRVALWAWFIETRIGSNNISDPVGLCMNRYKKSKQRGTQESVFLT